MILFPPVWDSSMISTLRSCPQKFFRTYVQHWKPQRESVHLVAGKAFAEGIEKARIAFYIDGKSREDSEAEGLKALVESYGDFECPADSAKSLERMCGALEFYLDQYRLGDDGADPIFHGDKRGIEFSFVSELPIDHPQTKDPLLFSGRADMIANFAGQIFLFDEKTTSSLGASWAKQWDMRSQFTGYTWAAKEHGIEAVGAIVRGISILKTKYDTQQAITYRPEWEINRWLSQVKIDIRRALEMWESGWWDYNLDHSCAEYGGCSMTSICKSNSPESWLPISFEKRVWNPITREETSVEDWEKQWL